MTESPLLSAIRQEMAALEATKARRGILTPNALRSCLPPWLAKQCSPAVMADIAKSINSALSDACQTERHDVKATAAGDA